MYADLLFLTEFLSDYLILHIVKEWTGYYATIKHLIISSLVGAFISTLLNIFLPDAPALFNLSAGILLCLVMVKIAFKPKMRCSLLNLISHSYATALIQGGIINFIQKRYPSFPYYIFFIIGFIVLKTGVFFKNKIYEKGEKLCQITIKFNNIIQSYTALIDTGNLLFDQKSNLPVSIIAEETLPEEFKAQATHSINFNSLGCTNGSLKIIYVPYICVEYKGEKKLIENAPLGLSTHKLSASDSYQMIISPEIINKMEI